MTSASTRPPRLRGGRFPQRGNGLAAAGASLLARLRGSLRARVTLGITLPIFIALSVLAGMRYFRERYLIEDQANLAAHQLSQVIASGLRQSLLTHDATGLTQIMRDYGYTEPVRRIQIANLAGQVTIDSGFRLAGQLQHVVTPGCTECHRLEPSARPTSILLPAADELLRVAVPVNNEPECQACHSANDYHLGILLVDLSARGLRTDVTQDVELDLPLSIATTLGLTIAVFLLVQRVIVARVESFRRPLAAYAAGEYSVRLPVTRSPDEMGELALAFNRMADEIERHLREEQQRGELRQRAIIEERERIARELHDGLAQVLGYVKNKATAVRLLLKREQTEAAAAQLAQLEEAAGALFIDVREAILGLKMTGRRELAFTAMLEDYAAQFTRLTELPVSIEIEPGVRQAQLPVEAEVQLLRIMQEALTNARKHARAKQARIVLSNGGPRVEMRVSDDGRGFNPGDLRPDGAGPHFGLTSMRERAESIGAEFQIESQPGAGTAVTVRLKLEARHAHPGR